MDMRVLSHFAPEKITFRKGIAALLLVLALSSIATHNRAAALSDVEFRTLSGETLSLDQFHGKPLLLSFWSTSCGICIKEMPKITKLYHTLEARGASLISISMPYDPPNHVLELSEELALPFPVAIDLDGALMRKFDIHGTPMKLLISPDGEIDQIFTGALDYIKTLNAVDKLLLTTSN